MTLLVATGENFAFLAPETRITVAKSARKAYILHMKSAKSKSIIAIPKILRHLKPQKARFVVHYVKVGNILEAAALTGISERTGNRYMVDPAVRDAVLDQLEQQRARWAVIGFKTLAEIAENTENNEVARISAAKELVKRGIGDTPQEINHRHRHEVTPNTGQLLGRIAELQKELGIDGKIIDAEFEEAEKPGRSLIRKLPFPVA